jgi:hypothetical protein
MTTQTHDFGSVESFTSIVTDERAVPHAGETDVYLKNPETGMLEHHDDHKAIHSEQTGDVFAVVTDDYEVINPPEIFEPLVDELSARGKSVTGTVNVYDGGARGFLEVVLDDETIYPADRSGEEEPVRAGIEARWSHDGGVSVRANAFAQDGVCENTMRRVSDAVYVKHAGDVSERVDFGDEWAAILDQLGAFSESLEEVIDAALEHELFRFGEAFDDDWVAATSVPSGLEDLGVPAFMTARDRDGVCGFYDLLGLPGYVCALATERLVVRLRQRDDPRRASAWDAYSALTWALTHHAKFERGSGTADQYHRTASDLLNNPPMVEQLALNELERRTAPEGGQAVLVEDDVGDAARSYKEREAELRAVMGR